MFILVTADNNRNTQYTQGPINARLIKSRTLNRRNGRVQKFGQHKLTILSSVHGIIIYAVSSSRKLQTLFVIPASIAGVQRIEE